MTTHHHGPLAVARAEAEYATFSFPNVPRGGNVEYRCRVNPDGEIIAIDYDDGYQGGPLTINGDDGGERLVAGIRRGDDYERNVGRARDFVRGLSVRADMLEEFDILAGRLATKMKLSQIPVPGFIVGLSGKDSTLGFLLVYEAALRMGIAHRVLGVHYVHAKRRRASWYEEHVVPWLRERCPLATILVETPLGGNHDQTRWADLHMRALNTIERDDDGEAVVRALPEHENYWVVGCTNLTEYELGKFSALSESVSVAPLRKIWNSKALAMCIALGVPAIVIEMARLPDCLCGRDELAASNIELIDAILKHDVRVEDHEPALFDQMMAYVRDLTRTNGFKKRTPYLL